VCRRAGCAAGGRVIRPARNRPVVGPGPAAPCSLAAASPCSNGCPRGRWRSCEGRGGLRRPAPSSEQSSHGAGR